MINLPYVTDEELKQTEMLCITGGEPFAYSDPVAIAAYYKEKYPNIKYCTVYTNAYELDYNFDKLSSWWFYENDIDGLNISIKEQKDVDAFFALLRNHTPILPMNRLYVFPNVWDKTMEVLDRFPEAKEKFEIIRREWQENFVPAPNCIFRRGA
jgi:MoaA/NifB/PqqE/SkfB family radical SAM enzyme